MLSLELMKIFSFKTINSSVFCLVLTLTYMHIHTQSLIQYLTHTDTPCTRNYLEITYQTIIYWDLSVWKSLSQSDNLTINAILINVFMLTRLIYSVPAIFKMKSEKQLLYEHSRVKSLENPLLPLSPASTLSVFSTKMGVAPTLNKEASFSAEGDHFQLKPVNM